MKFDPKGIQEQINSMSRLIKAIQDKLMNDSFHVELTNITFFIAQIQMLMNIFQESNTPNDLNIIVQIKHYSDLIFEHAQKILDRMQKNSQNPCKEKESELDAYQEEIQPLVFKRCLNPNRSTCKQILEDYIDLMKDQPVGQWLIRESRIPGMITVTCKKVPHKCLMIQVDSLPNDFDEAKKYLKNLGSEAIYFYNIKKGLSFASYTELTKIATPDELVAELFEERLNFFFSEVEELSLDQLETIKRSTQHEATFIAHYRYAYEKKQWVHANDHVKIKSYQCYDRKSLGSACESLLKQLNSDGFVPDNKRCIPLLPKHELTTKEACYGGYFFPQPNEVEPILQQASPCSASTLSSSFFKIPTITNEVNMLSSLTGSL